MRYQLARYFYLALWGITGVLLAALGSCWGIYTSKSLQTASCDLDGRVACVSKDFSRGLESGN